MQIEIHQTPDCSPPQSGIKRRAASRSWISETSPRGSQSQQEIISNPGPALFFKLSVVWNCFQGPVLISPDSCCCHPEKTSKTNGLLTDTSPSSCSWENKHDEANTGQVKANISHGSAPTSWDQWWIITQELCSPLNYLPDVFLPPSDGLLMLSLYQGYDHINWR